MCGVFNLGEVIVLDNGGLMSCSCCEYCERCVIIDDAKWCTHFYFCKLRLFEIFFENRIRSLVDSLQTEYITDYVEMVYVLWQMQEIVEESEKELKCLQQNEMYSNAMLELSVNYMDGLYGAMCLFEDLDGSDEEKTYQEILLSAKEILASILS